MSFVTFITATVGRATLADAVKSVEAQTDPDWRHIIVGDGINPAEVVTPRSQQTFMFEHERRYHEADMRNHGIACAQTEWVAFLDDDDTLAPEYVEWLKEEADDNAVVIFRQTLPIDMQRDDAIIPARPEIVWGNVGISYAMKRKLASHYPFKRTRHEDLLQLVAVEAVGAKIHFSNHIAYYGRGHRG